MVAEVLSPGVVVFVVDDIVVVGVGFEAIVDGADGCPPRRVVRSIDEAVVAVVAGHSAEEATDFAARPRRSSI